MIKITVKTDCGNAPKKLFLKQYNSAFVKGDIYGLVQGVTDTIVWTIVGGKTIKGIDEFREALQHMKKSEVVELNLEHILTHGRTGAVNGVIKKKDGKHIAFSDFYEFSGAKEAKIKAITSYAIEI